MYDQQPLPPPKTSLTTPNTTALIIIGAFTAALGHYAGQGVATALIGAYPGSGNASLLVLLGQAIPFVSIIVTAATASLALLLVAGQKGSRVIAITFAASLYAYLFSFIVVAMNAHTGVSLSNVPPVAVAGALTFPAIYFVFKTYDHVKFLPAIIITAGVIGSLVLPAALSDLADRASVTSKNRSQQNSIASGIVSQPLQATASLEGYDYQPLRLETGPYDLQSAEGASFARKQAYLYAAYESPRSTIEIHQTESAQWINDFIAVPETCDITQLHSSFATKARGAMGPYFQPARCTELGTTNNGRIVYGSLKPEHQTVNLPYFYTKIDRTVITIKITQKARQVSSQEVFDASQKDTVLRIVESLEPVDAREIVL